MNEILREDRDGADESNTDTPLACSMDIPNKPLEARIMDIARLGGDVGFREIAKHSANRS